MWAQEKLHKTTHTHNLEMTWNHGIHTLYYDLEISMGFGPVYHHKLTFRELACTYSGSSGFLLGSFGTMLTSPLPENLCTCSSVWDVFLLDVCRLLFFFLFYSGLHWDPGWSSSALNMHFSWCEVSSVYQHHIVECHDGKFNFCEPIASGAHRSIMGKGEAHPSPEQVSSGVTPGRFFVVPLSMCRWCQNIMETHLWTRHNLVPW